MTKSHTPHTPACPYSYSYARLRTAFFLTMPLVSVLNWYRMRACPAKPTPPPEPFSPSLQTVQQPHQPKPGSAAPPKRPRRSTATLLLQKPLRKRMPVGTGNSHASEWGASPCFAAATKNVDAVNSK